MAASWLLCAGDRRYNDAINERRGMNDVPGLLLYDPFLTVSPSITPLSASIDRAAAGGELHTPNRWVSERCECAFP